MKAKTIINNYEQLLADANDFIYEKLNLEDVSNDYVFFAVMHVTHSPHSAFTRILVDRVIGSVLHEPEWDGTFYYDAPSIELDEFRKTGKVDNVLNYEQLVKIDMSEEDEDSDDILDAPLIGH